jgi:hypothetical protein
MKGKCPPLKRGREDEARGMEDGNGAGQKMHIGEDEDEGMEDGIGTQVGKIVQSGDNSSQLHKGRSKYFSQWLVFKFFCVRGFVGFGRECVGSF